MERKEFKITFLRKNHLELSELKNMLNKTEVFLSENQLNLAELDENTSKLDYNTQYVLIILYSRTS